ncbi:MAG: hypothetical protein FJX74_08195 [Armatimonadetes bacterium]|nr:hypothetical protein [Armatimonadota bacterium]
MGMCTTCRIMNLTGKARKSDGTAVTQSQVMRFDHEDGQHTEGPFNTAANGTYTVSLPLPGKWYVYLNTCPARPASIVVDVPSGWCTRNFRRTCDEGGNPE